MSVKKNQTALPWKMMVGRRSFPFQKAKLWGVVCIYNQCPPAHWRSLQWKGNKKNCPTWSSSGKHDELNRMNVAIFFYRVWLMTNHDGVINVLTKFRDTKSGFVWHSWGWKKPSQLLNGFRVWGGLMVESMVGKVLWLEKNASRSLEPVLNFTRVPRSKSSMKSRTQAKFCVRRKIYDWNSPQNGAFTWQSWRDSPWFLGPTNASAG